MKEFNVKDSVFGGITVLLLLSFFIIHTNFVPPFVPTFQQENVEPKKEKSYIKWVDFNVSSEALNKAYDWDVKTYGKKPHINWITLLAYEAAKTGGTFDDKAVSDMENCAKQMVAGKFDLEKQAKELKYYPYYKEAYGI